MLAASRREAMRLSAGNRTVATATLNRPCGSMYSRKALSIARGASADTSVPNSELMSWSRLTMPRPIMIGSISANTCLTRRSRQSNENLRSKCMRRSAASATRNCTTVAARIPIASA